MYAGDVVGGYASWTASMIMVLRSRCVLTVDYCIGCIDNVYLTKI